MSRGQKFARLKVNEIVLYAERLVRQIQQPKKRKRGRGYSRAHASMRNGFWLLGALKNARHDAPGTPIFMVNRRCP